MNSFSIFLGDEYLGDGTQVYPESTHYFCRKCGEVWARAVAHVPAQHTVWTGHCPEHDTEGWGPAVLCETFRFRPIQFPLGALKRDLLYLMSKDARFIGHNPPTNPTLRATHEHQTAA